MNILPIQKYQTLKEYYESLPHTTRKKKFVDKLVSLTGKSEVNIYRWINGVFEPNSLLDRKLIAKMTGISEDVLFPKSVKYEQNDTI